MKEKVVFDCMVYLQAVTNQHSPSRACFALAESGVIELHSSEMILDEIRQVLLRPTTLSRFPQLTHTMVDAFIAWVRSFFHHRICSSQTYELSS